MSITKEIWIAMDGNGDLFAFESEPTLQWAMSANPIWVPKTGSVTPLRQFLPALEQFLQNEQIDVQKEPFKATLTLDI